MWPLLKKSNLNLLDQIFYPALNLSFTSKSLQRAAAYQLLKHLNRNNLFEDHQSAYREFHSTETALLNIKTDIMNSIDNKQVACLILLDLSAAINTVDHSFLLQRPEHRYSINGTALQWFKSLSPEQDAMCCNSGVLHWWCDLWWGDLDLWSPPSVSPQSPSLHLVLWSPGDLCQSHGINFQMYTDYQQIYMSFKWSRISRIYKRNVSWW